MIVDMSDGDMTHALREDECLRAIFQLSPSMSSTIYERTQAYLCDVLRRVDVRSVRGEDTVVVPWFPLDPMSQYPTDRAGTARRVVRDARECVSRIRADVYARVLSAVADNRRVLWRQMDQVVDTSLRDHRLALYQASRGARIEYRRRAMAPAHEIREAVSICDEDPVCSTGYPILPHRIR